VTAKTAVILLALVEFSSAAVAQTRGVPTAIPAPTIYSRPAPAPVSPPINPGPATVPPAGLSSLLTQPGPIAPSANQGIPAYPAAQLPGPTGEQSLEAYRNGLLDQRWHLERSGVSPDSERSREVQQQLNQLDSR
jgi:hypothetical protein